MLIVTVEEAGPFGCFYVYGILWGDSEMPRTDCHRGLILIRGTNSSLRGEGNERDHVRCLSAALPACFIQSQMLVTLGWPGLGQ